MNNSKDKGLSIRINTEAYDRILAEVSAIHLSSNKTIASYKNNIKKLEEEIKSNSEKYAESIKKKNLKEAESLKIKISKDDKDIQVMNEMIESEIKEPKINLIALEKYISELKNEVDNNKKNMESAIAEAYKSLTEAKESFYSNMNDVNELILDLEKNVAKKPVGLFNGNGEFVYMPHKHSYYRENDRKEIRCRLFEFERINFDLKERTE